MPQSQAVSPLVNLFPLILIFVIFYFMLIRPQKTKEKEHQKMILNLKKNDEVVTFGGIHGTIIAVKDNTFILRIDDNAKIEIDKSAVSRITKVQAE